MSIDTTLAKLFFNGSSSRIKKGTIQEATEDTQKHII